MKSGFIGIIGRPNAGKSTLLNSLIGEKIAIMTDKPQTTRDIIRGIKTTDDTQYIFVDTPGIHKPKHKLGASMNSDSYSTINEVDLVYYMFDSNTKFGSGDEFVINQLKNSDIPVFLILNKVDLIKKDDLMNLITELNNKYNFAEVIPISALNNDNISKLLEVTKSYLSDTVQYYPSEQNKEYTEDFIISEIVREKIINLTQEEIPHSIAVVTENLKVSEKNLKVSVLIIVERDSQKGIIIGKQGSMLKRIRNASLSELQVRYNKRVHLEMYVKVEKDWRNNPNKIKKYNLNEV